MDHKYCVYLTMYKGELLPKWYIGSSTIQKVKNGYNGTILSKKWYNIYQNEQKENKHLFKTRILSTHETRKQALEEELRVQKLHSVRDNSKYFNESYATVNGYFGKNLSAAERKVLSENSKNKVTCKNIITSQYMQVDKTEFDNNENLVGVNKGKKFQNSKNKNTVVARCLDTDMYIKVSKEEFDNNENLVGTTKGKENTKIKNTFLVYDEDNNIIRIKKEDYDKTKYRSTILGKLVVKDSEGKTYLIDKNDERYLSGELTAFNKGKKFGVEFSKKISDIRILNGSGKGSKNGMAKMIIIFNPDDEPMYFSHGNFNQMCKENNLPFRLFAKSYKNNTKLFEHITEEYIAKTPKFAVTKTLNSNHYKDFKDWYAKIMQRVKI